MKSIAIPIQLVKGGLARTEDPRKSIDSALSLLMSTSCFSSAADPQYGFIFNNVRFEIFDENEGVVYNSSGSRRLASGWEGLYHKKISGSSTNMNTFAAERKRTLETYEKRLQDVSVSMTYVREERKIYVTVKGVIADTGSPYKFLSIINVWK